ncbi:MAG TPA: FAD-dependent oxidoreductase, partial [Steroidobacteraceae bacterium]|nr:FAD-dependent oxidoreductase [Steroidobacteraceae bacterium]
MIGGGIAGLSAAAALADTGQRVVLLEREPQFSYHSTGRSAALFAESYGNEHIRALTRASRSFYCTPGGDTPFTSPRGALFVARPDQREALSALFDELAPSSPNARRLDPQAVAGVCPALRSER